MDPTSQSAARPRLDAERDAEHAAHELRAKEARASRQRAEREQREAERARRQAADAAKGIPADWDELQKSIARKAHADRQRSARQAAESAANPPLKIVPKAVRRVRPAAMHDLGQSPAPTLRAHPGR